MTASSILRSRRDSSGEAISANLGTTSNQCQVCGEAVEAQPTRRREDKPPICLHRTPACVNPRLSTNKFRTRETQAIRSAQPEIHRLGRPVFVVERLAAGCRIRPGRQLALPLDVRVHVPAPSPAVELVSTWTEASVRHGPPVARVVLRAASCAGEIRHLIMLEPSRSQCLVSVEKLLFVPLLGGLGHDPPIAPAAEGRLRLRRETIEI